MPTTLADLLAPARFFDFAAHPFEHQKLFARPGVQTVVDALDHIGPYCQDMFAQFPEDYCDEYEVAHNDWPSTVCEGMFRVILDEGTVFSPDRIIAGADGAPFVFLDRGAQVRGGVLDLRGGSVFIGADAVVEGAWLCGPALIGGGAVVRPGAYLRGNVILGRNVTARGELKNAVIMDESDFPHPSYLGDSICGYHTHFGNNVTAANLSIFGRKGTLTLKHDGQTYDLGRRKIGIIMGDFAQVGCGAVSDPGTFLLPHTIVYALTRINGGIYGPHEVLKNKPMEHGVIERAPLRT
jgi:hypothetical protein